MSRRYRRSKYFKRRSAREFLPRVPSRSAGQITKNVHVKLIYGAYSLRPPRRFVCARLSLQPPLLLLPREVVPVSRQDSSR